MLLRKKKTPNTCLRLCWEKWQREHGLAERVTHTGVGVRLSWAVLVWILWCMESARSSFHWSPPHPLIEKLNSCRNSAVKSKNVRKDWGLETTKASEGCSEQSVQVKGASLTSSRLLQSWKCSFTSRHLWFRLNYLGRNGFVGKSALCYHLTISGRHKLS